MAGAIAKLFKKKGNKENNEPIEKLRDDSDNCSRSNSRSFVNVYTSDTRQTICRVPGNLPRGNSANDALLLYDNGKLPFVSPYAIITEPKTRKPTRSCPGASIHVKASSIASYAGASFRRRRCLSPDGRHSNRPPTIFEISGSYENYPNENAQAYRNHGGKNAFVYERPHNRTQHIMDAQGLKQTAVGSLRERSFQRQQAKRQSLNLRNVDACSTADGDDRRTRYRYGNICTAAASTSEYGSADPSPTNAQAAASTTKRSFNNNRFNDNSFDESDSDDGEPMRLIDLCEKELKIATEERAEFKNQMRVYKRKYLQSRSELDEALERLEYERRKCETLKAELEKAKTERENFRRFINQQFRNVNGHYRISRHPHEQTHPHSQQQKQQRPQLQNIEFYQDEVHRLQNEFPQLADHCQQQQQQQEQQQRQASSARGWPDEDECASVNNAYGAGEALCSHSEVFGADNTAFSEFVNTIPIAPPTISASLKNGNEEELDEKIVFRNQELEEDKISSISYGNNCVEQARDAIIRHASDDHFSPPFKSIKKKITLDEDHAIAAHSNPDDGYSTIRNVKNTVKSNGNNEADKKQSLYDGESALSSDDSLDIASIDKLQAGRRRKPRIIQQLDNMSSRNEKKNVKSIRRSFSDTDVSEIKVDSRNNVVNLDENNEEWTDANNNYVVGDKYDVDEEEDKIEEKTTRIRLVGFQRNVENTSKATVTPAMRRALKTRFCHYSPRRNADSSSYSSDDDAIHVFARQLRRRGDVVEFRPPRKNLVSMKRKLFRHFGSGERDAIAQFDYLKDMPTDVSELVSSPGSQ